LEKSSSETLSFFCKRSLIEDKVSSSRITIKKGSPKFWTCCGNKDKYAYGNEDKYQAYPSKPCQPE
jgi:RNase P subunit RPR2